MSDRHTNVTADRLAVRALVTRYAQHVDARDSAGIASVFTEDAVFRIFDNFSVDARIEIASRAQIGARLPGFVERFLRTFHPMTTHWATFDGSAGTGVTYCYSSHFDPVDDLAGHDVMALSRYEDIYRKIDGQWLIAARDVRFQWKELRSAKLISQ